MYRNFLIALTSFGLVVSVSTTAAAQSVFNGRVIVNGAETSDILVTLMRESGQILEETYTSVRGDFTFEGLSPTGVTNGNYTYIVIEEEGFKPYRQRIDQSDLRGRSTTFTIFLEPETATNRDGGTAGTVDVYELLPDVREAYEQAVEDAADGDHEAAARQLERAVELAPLYYDAWINLGVEYAELDRFEDAMNAYLEANRIDPAGFLAPLNLGVLYYQEGERRRSQVDESAGSAYGESVPWLTDAIDLDPTSAPARFYLGAALYRLGFYEESETVLQTALDVIPGYADARSMLINVYVRMNRHDAALEQAVAFLEENPDSPQQAAIARVRDQLEDALGR